MFRIFFQLVSAASGAINQAGRVTVQNGTDEVIETIITGEDTFIVQKVNKKTGQREILQSGSISEEAAKADVPIVINQETVDEEPIKEGDNDKPDDDKDDKEKKKKKNKKKKTPQNTNGASTNFASAGILLTILYNLI